MKIAFTGASGFLGSACLRHFAKAGHSLVALGRTLLPEGSRSLAEFRACDYQEAALVSGTRDVDALVHLAALRDSSPSADAQALDVNARVAGAAARAAVRNGLKRICLASTFAVYSDCDGAPFREEGSTHPFSPYGASKLEAENVAAGVTQGTSTALVILRFSQLYGPGCKGLALNSFLESASRNETLELWGDGGPALDRLYVDDAVSAIEAALMAPQPGAQLFNVGSGLAISTRELIDVVNEVFHQPGKVRSVPAQSTESAAPRYLDITRAASLLGWRPRVSLKEGVSAMAGAM